MKNKLTQTMVLTIRSCSWLIWVGSIIIIGFSLIPTIAQFKAEQIEVETEFWFIYLVLGCFIFALLESLMTAFVKHFFLIRPKEQGRFNENSIEGSLKFLVINTLILFFVNCIAYYGIILFYQSGRLSNIYCFGTIWLLLIIYHIPNLNITSDINQKIKSISKRSSGPLP
ncbi:MAG: hypothetical protein GY705_27555 [Bacteroidetes bacterium]|nr:hypothetical protein [Bacteroidota bacterium]